VGHDSLALVCSLFRQGTGITKALCQPLPRGLLSVDRVLSVDSQGWNMNYYRVKVQTLPWSSRAGYVQTPRACPRPGFLPAHRQAYCHHALMLLTELLCPECPPPSIHPSKFFIPQILAESCLELPLNANAHRLNPTLTAWHSILSHALFLVATSSLPKLSVSCLRGSLL